MRTKITALFVVLLMWTSLVGAADSSGITKILSHQFGGTNYFIVMGPITAVFFSPTQMINVEEDIDIWDGKTKVWRGAAPKGAKVCAIPLGKAEKGYSGWPGQGRGVEKVDLSKSLSCGTIGQNGEVEFPFQVTHKERYGVGVNFVVDINNDGKGDAWGSHPGYYKDEGSPFHEPWTFGNPEGRPMTAWMVDPAKKKIEPVPQENKAYMSEVYG